MCNTKMGKIKIMKNFIQKFIIYTKTALGEMLLPNVARQGTYQALLRKHCGRQHSKMQNFNNKKCNKLS